MSNGTGAMQRALAQALEEAHARIAQVVLDLDDAALVWRPAPGLPTIAELIAQAARAERRWIGEGVAQLPSEPPDDATQAAELSEAAPHPLFALGSAGQFSQVILGSLPPGEWGRERRVDGRTVTVAGCALHSLEQLSHTLGQIELIVGLWRQTWQQR